MASRWPETCHDSSSIRSITGAGVNSIQIPVTNIEILRYMMLSVTFVKHLVVKHSQQDR